MEYFDEDAVERSMVSLTYSYGFVLFDSGQLHQNTMSFTQFVEVDAIESGFII